MYGGILDLGLDDEKPFSDYLYSMSESKRMLDANDFDYAVVLSTDFELVNEHRMTNDEYMDWLFETCSVDDRASWDALCIQPQSADRIRDSDLGGDGEGWRFRKDPSGGLRDSWQDQEYLR